MQGHYSETLRFQPESCPGISPVDPVSQQLVCVDHDVSDPTNSRVRDAFAMKVLIGIGGRGPQHVRDRVGNDSVDLFGHRPVAAPESGFDVAQRDAKLCGNKGASQRGIHVSDDDDPVRSPRLANPFIGNHDSGRLFRMCATSNPKLEIRVREAEIGEKRVRHIRVVVLTGMHQDRPTPTLVRESVIERGHIMKFGRAPAIK